MNASELQGTIAQREGIAWRIVGYGEAWETVLAVMVGDNRVWELDADEFHPVDENRVCSCGEVGCWA